MIWPLLVLIIGSNTLLMSFWLFVLNSQPLKPVTVTFHLHLRVSFVDLCCKCTTSLLTIETAAKTNKQKPNGVSEHFSSVEKFALVTLRLWLLLRLSVLKH